MSFFRHSAVVGGLVALSLPACLVHSVEREPKPPLEAPEKFSEAGEQGAAAHGRWWSTLGDKELEGLVERALAHNFQLRQSWARLRQSRAVARAAAAGLFPNLDVTTSAGRSKSAPRIFNLGGTEQTIPGSETNSFNASIPLSYELDVWGRVRSGWFAAQEDELAARADVETAALTLAANVTERWLDLLEQRALLRLVGQQLKHAAAFRDLVALRFTGAQGALSDVYQQEQQVQQLEAQKVALDTAEALADKQLSVLLGAAPNVRARAAREVLPEPPPLPDVGVPARLLNDRPDLRLLRHRVVAADYRLGQAIAARFPTLQLTGSIGFSATALAQFFDSFVWSFLGSLSANLWDGGRRGAEVERAEAVIDDTLAAYGQALLGALYDVEATLVQERQQRARIRLAEEQLATANKTVEAAKLRYEAGVAEGYLTALTAILSQQGADRSLLTERRRLVSLRVQLYRALGGAWSRELAEPKVERRPEPDAEPKAAPATDAEPKDGEGA